MKSGADERLARYFDGELPAEDAEALRAELAEDAALQAKLDGLAHFSALMKAGAEERAHELDADSLFSAISARLDDADALDDDPMFPGPVVEEPVAEVAPARERPALRVVSGGRGVSGDPASRASDPGPVFAARPVRRERKNGVLLGVVSGVLAAAAAVLLGVMRDPSSGETMSLEPVASGPPAGSEVEEVDFGYSTGAIFSVEGQEGEHYAVIWISDEKIDAEDGTETLQ